MQDTQNTVVVGGNVKGDVTSCKIENQVIRVDRRSAWSIQEVTTYASYDVCSKRIISQYSVPGITGLVGFIIFLLIICAMVGGIVAMLSRIIDANEHPLFQ